MMFCYGTLKGLRYPYPFGSMKRQDLSSGLLISEILPPVCIAYCLALAWRHSVGKMEHEGADTFHLAPYLQSQYMNQVLLLLVWLVDCQPPWHLAA